MYTGILNHGRKSHHFITTVLKKRSVSDPIGAPFRRSHVQQSFYSRFPKTKAKEMEISLPIPATSSNTNATTFLSSISKSGVIGWYLGMIKARPILTKSVTSALIYTAADLSSQTLTRTSSEAYDPVRTFRMAGYGMIILGPSLHFWFNFVSRVLPRTDVITTFKKMFMGQAIYGPIMTAVFYSVNAGLQGETGPEIIARLKRDLLPTMMNGAMYWPVCDFITFRFIPVHLQPLVSNSFSYVWTVYMTYMASLEKAETK